MKVTAGLGWGKFVGENSFDNPLSFLSNKFELRPRIFRISLMMEEFHSYDKWFRGNSSLFGGLEYFCT